MVKRTTPQPQIRTVLLIPLVQAKERIFKQLDKGNQILEMEMRSEEEYTQVNAKYRIWDDYTEELLKQIFNTDEVAQRFSGVGAFVLGGGRIPLSKEIEFLRNEIRGHLERLASIYERLELYPVESLERIPREEPDKSNVPTKSPASITIHNYGTIYNPQIQQGSPNASQSILTTDDSSEIRNLIEHLAREVESMSGSLPEETARQAKQDLSVFIGEATSKAPRKEWWQLSADGLKKAATNVGEIGKPVIELVTRIVALLLLIDKAS